MEIVQINSHSLHSTHHHNYFPIDDESVIKIVAYHFLYPQLIISAPINYETVPFHSCCLNDLVTHLFWDHISHISADNPDKQVSGPPGAVRLHLASPRYGSHPGIYPQPLLRRCGVSMGGLAPTDSEVRNLHLIIVCQPMIRLRSPESLSLSLSLRLSD